MSTNEKKEQKKDYDYLVKLSNAYYNTGTPLVTDQQFDRLVDDYEKKYNTSYTYLGKSNHGKKKLPYYMGSLDKCKTQHALSLFVNRNKSCKSFVLSDKLDGLSLLYGIDENQKPCLYTRGDGSVGSNVSHLLPYLRLPSLQGWTQGEFVRGELVLPKTMKNARNLVSGLVNSKTVDEALVKETKFVAYWLFTPNVETRKMTYSDMLLTLAKCKFMTPSRKVVKADEVQEHLLNTYFYERSSESFCYIDGIVIQSDEETLEYNEGENPKNACAFKVQTPTKETKVLSVEWNVSAFKTWHPIVNIEPIDWDGAIIRKCSGFHAKYILENKVGPGAIIEVTRSGDVIPDIVSVLEPAEEAQMPIIDDIEFEWKGVHLYADVETEDSIIAQLVRFFTTIDVPGLKEQTIRAIVQGTKCRSEYDFIYKLTLDELCALSGFGPKKGEKIMQSLELCKEKISLPILMKGSAMFKGFAEKKLEKICFDLEPMILEDKVDNETVIGVCAANGIHKNASEMVEALPNFIKKYKRFLEQLSTSISSSKENPRKRPSPSKDGINVVCTGFRPDKKVQEEADRLGYVFQDNVTKSTNFLVLKDQDGVGSSKAKKAQELNIKVILKNEFLEMLNL